MPTLDNELAYVYVLVEAQSTVDYWITFRLWKYMLLLIEKHKEKNKGRHQKEQDKLPLIAPIVVYSGDEIYTAPKNLWQLFSNPEQAKKLMVEDCKMIDLQSMSDDEIKQKKHLGMMEYFLKNIHQRDMLKLWEEFLKSFKSEILIDKEKGYI